MSKSDRASYTERGRGAMEEVDGGGEPAANHIVLQRNSSTNAEPERDGVSPSQGHYRAHGVSSVGTTADSTRLTREAEVLQISATGDASNRTADANEKSRLRRERNAQRARHTNRCTPPINLTTAADCAGSAPTSPSEIDSGEGGAIRRADSRAATSTSSQRADRRRNKERMAMASSADAAVVEAYPPGETSTLATVVSGPVLLDHLSLGQSTHEITIEEADAMVGTDVTSVVVGHNRGAFSSSSSLDDTPGAFPMQGRALGVRAWSRVFSRRQLARGASVSHVLNHDGLVTMQEDPNLLVAETVDAETVVYASGVVKERPRWVYYALGTLAVTFVLALVLSLTLTRNRDNGDPRCAPPIEEQNIYDLCFCQQGDGNASLLSLNQFETDLYNTLQGKLSDLKLLNHTLDRHSCDFENQAVLRMANVERDPVMKEKVKLFREGEDWNASGINAKLLNETASQLIQQVFVLQILYLSTGGADWDRKDGWNSTLRVCLWHGVACSIMERVQMVRLPFNNLKGSIPWQIGHMPFLKTLDLSKNPGLAGTMPSKLGDLSSLREIDLTASGLSGTLPSEIFRLGRLGRLALSNNSFTGTVPNPEGLRRVREFSIGDAGLEGTLPSQLGTMKNLHVLTLHNNSFTGTIPALLGNATRLEQLDLSHNRLTGTIPLAVYKLGYLNLILVTETDLTGEIPQDFCNEHVQELILSSCNATKMLTNGQDCSCCDISHICVEDLPSLLQDIAT